MNIELSAIDASYVRELVQNGYFKSEGEAVSVAISYTKKLYEVKKQRLLDALAEGDEDIEADRTIPYTPTLLDELLSEAKTIISSGEKIDYDSNVIP
ncbi:hypothetical protein [Scytonema sp. NUACC26]|uniref:hypothetical protein n=1 Tax=Scytonema sp. NUACC26 TaxID=3140176 RepID=UPI0034DBBF2C